MHGDNSKSKAKNTTAKTFRKIGDSVTNKQSLDENVLHYVKNVIATIIAGINEVGMLDKIDKRKVFIVDVKPVGIIGQQWPFCH